MDQGETIPLANQARSKSCIVPPKCWAQATRPKAVATAHKAPNPPCLHLHNRPCFVVNTKPLDNRHETGRFSGSKVDVRHRLPSAPQARTPNSASWCCRRSLRSEGGRDQSGSGSKQPWHRQRCANATAVAHRDRKATCLALCLWHARMFHRRRHL